MYLACIIRHILLVRSKYPPETLHEYGLAEQILHHQLAVCGLHQLSHLQYAHLIQQVCKYTHYVHGQRRRDGLHHLRTRPFGILVLNAVPFVEAGVELAGRLVQ